MSTPNGRCAVCASPERLKIELALASGGPSQTAVARKFNLSMYAVHRHWANHVSDERKARLLVGPVQAHALAARISEENSNVLDNLRVIRAGLFEQYDSALQAADRNSTALLAGKLHQNLQITARITGELASSPLVTINNNQNNVAMLTDSAPFQAFQSRLIAVLRLFPDARDAVIREFERLDSMPSSPPAPQLTHEAQHEAA
jgi:hypothetical protein